MKSSSALRLLPLALLLVVGAVVHELQPLLFEIHSNVRRREDANYLPGPDTTKLLSLGYRSALADLIFAHLLVSYGQHFQERRRMEFAAHYLDVITSLDAHFREPYRLADTLIVLQSTAPGPEDYRAARRIQDRGLEAFPYDQELWLIAGQFLAYIAAPHVPPSEYQDYRLEGAKRLARSCELIGSNQAIPHHCITAAVLFSEAGKRDVVRGFLERVMAISDDVEIQTLAGGYLQRVASEAEQDRVEQRNKRFRARWQNDFTFVSREMLALLGPKFDPARCAGVLAAETNTCIASFRAWGERLDQPE